jgi:hypothetical protein
MGGGLTLVGRDFRVSEASAPYFFSLGEIQYCQYLSVLRVVISSYLVLGSQNDWHKKHCQLRASEWAG